MLLFLTGSEFQPDEVAYSDINPPVQPDPPIQIDLNDSHDTIKIGRITQLHYNITGTSYRINSVIVKLGRIVIHNYIADNEQIIRQDSMPTIGYSGKIAFLSSDATKMIAKTDVSQITYYTLDTD